MDMKIKKQLQANLEEIELLIRYAVNDEERRNAEALLEEYRANPVALSV